MTDNVFIASFGTPEKDQGWQPLGETSSPPALTIDEMVSLVDRLTFVVMCHPDAEAWVRDKVEDMRGRFEVVTSDAVGRNQILLIRNDAFSRLHPEGWLW